MTDQPTGLTDAQKAYNVAQSEVFQLAAYGHHRYHPLQECLTPEGKQQQSDYNDRIRAAREALEAALLRLVADHGERYRTLPEPIVGWLRTLADDPAEVSLLAVTPDELKEAGLVPAVPVSSPPPDQTADRAAAERLSRVLEFVTSEVVTAKTEFGNGYREAQRDIRDLIRGRFDNDAANELRRLAAEAQQPDTETRAPWGTRPACRCSHAADEHSVYGCVDGCACEWMPKRKPMDPIHILGVDATPEPPPVHKGGNADDCPACQVAGLDTIGPPYECPGPEATA